MNAIKFINHEKIARSKINYSWCAGFFSGEGTTGFYCERRNGKDYGRLRIQIAQCEKLPLDMFKSLIGRIGNVTGPYKPNGMGNRPYFMYLANQKDSLLALDRMWAFLTEVKKKQASIGIKKYEKYQFIPNLIPRKKRR